MDPFIPGLPRDPEPFAQILDRFLFPAPPIDKLVPAFHGIPLFKGHLPSFGGLLSFFLLPMSPVCFVTHVPGPYQTSDVTGRSRHCLDVAGASQTEFVLP